MKPPLSLRGGEPEWKAALVNKTMLFGSVRGWGGVVEADRAPTTKLPNLTLLSYTTILKELLLTRNFYLQLLFLLRGKILSREEV